MQKLCIYLLLLLPLMCGAATENPESLVEQAAQLVRNDQQNAALGLLARGRLAHPRDIQILAAYANLLYDLDKLAPAMLVYRELLELGDNPVARERLAAINKQFERLTSSVNLATIAIQKNVDAGNYQTALAIGNLAIEKFPDSAVLYTAMGEAQYRNGDLDEAEVTFRRALQIDPFNRQARSYVEEIRTTEQAQTSTELAEWISIAKDKVGDFIVTFLALFAAFVTNSLVAPIILRIKLNRARRAFELGQYDEFTDLIEGLLDKEDFAPLRANFRFLLREKDIDEARSILDKYVNTPDRLPALLRILEREHEKMAQSA